MEQRYHTAVNIIHSGGIVVMPSDTIYGIFASAKNPDAVEKLYHVRGRQLQKPCIILITSVNDVATFGIILSDKEKRFLTNVWNGERSALHSIGIEKVGAISVVLPCTGQKYAFLHRGTKSLAFRVPCQKTKRGKILLQVLKKTGPLIAPSANPEGAAPAATMREARKYFGTQCDCFIAHGKKLESAPSKVVCKKNDQWIFLR